MGPPIEVGLGTSMATSPQSGPHAPGLRGGSTHV